jgi:phosphoribosylformylglycinamidine synthase
VLTEAGLLPGALRRNDGLRFICETVGLTVTSSASVLTAQTSPGAMLRLPINHYEGAYTCDNATLVELQRTGRIVLRYTANPNGSLDDIAGITNEHGNVVGLMPHPERASDLLTGGDDGLALLESFVAASLRFATAGSVAAVSA